MKTFGSRALALLGGVGLIAGIAGIVWIVMIASSGARDQARGFVEDLAIRDYPAARARLHAQLQRQLSENALEQMFGGSESYVDVSFSSISVENGQAELSGTATTASDCSSEVSFELIGDQIVMFDFTPLCPAP